ncbi:hypothetical protein PGTUg99_050095 [Puccinia graminis f. sp. tritici]|uniref:RNA-directed DNA polymerase n=1 Tax=Puccinia graminis f. sp. tritici TaxID=56615 RepID=A0A5B0S2R7_PUCGR|nr:hypothetical protein PGTUg99_050095 [Puccinia graminis f. sp. tritici]
MDAAMNDGNQTAARDAARDEVILNLQQQVQQLMANALNQQAQRAEAAPRVETISVRLPDFDGKGDVDIWIKKIECILAGRNYPQDRWTSMIIQNLKDTAKAYWFNLISEMGTADIPWATFKQKLTDQFNYAHKQYDARVEMQFLKYTTAEEYINKFKCLAIKLPADKMTDKDKKFHFTVNLPGHLRVKLLSEKCDTLDDLCHFVREYERVTKSSNYRGNSGNHSFNNYRSFGSNNFSSGHFRRSSHNNFTPARRTSVSASAPMDLDALDAPDKHRARPSLNLIDLDPPENSKSTSNLFFIQPTKPEEDSYDKINADLKRISNNLSKKFDNVVASIRQEIWNIDRNKEALLMCSRIESGLSVLNPKALEFIPGASRHGITRELQLNTMQIEAPSTSMKRKANDVEDKPNKLAKVSDCDYIDWLQIDSDTESYEFELESDSGTSSIVWMGDSPTELEKTPPPLDLNHLDEEEKTLPRYEFGIGAVICDTIIDSGAGAVYLDVAVADELYNRREIDIVYVEPRNVRLANGHIEEVKMKAKFELCIDNNITPIEAFLINLPEMDLVLGLPWLCQTRAVPDYDDLSYTFLDAENKVVNVKPYNLSYRAKDDLLNSIVCETRLGSLDNEFAKIAYGTAPEAFQEIVGLPKDKVFEHDIDTGDSAPAKVHGRPYSPPEHQLIEKFVEDGLKEGIIRPSKSPWSAPIILVKKPDGSSRFLAGAKIFSSIDLKSGFWQVKLTDRSIPKTAFATRNGAYEFLVMPFGLCNAPATFQHMINNILRECLVSEKKCTWGQKQLLFLGHIVGGKGINVDDRKIDKITAWPTPTNITEVRGFLNLATYYKRFIKDFSKIATPIYKLTQGSPKKGASIEWGEEQDESFKKLKYYLTQTVLLHHPKPFSPFILDTDASGQNIGAVLQQDPNGEKIDKNFDLEQFSKTVKNANLKPIAYESRKLSKTEQNYSAQERELLAIVHALKHFRGYIEGSPILVRTDHESLKYFKTQRHVNRILARFVDEIEFFNVHIIYRPGPEQIAADALSRKPDGPSDLEPPEVADSLFSIEPVIEDTFKRLQELRNEHESALETKGYVLKNGDLYKTDKNRPDLIIITDLDRAKKLALETHIRLGHRNARDTLFQLRTECHFPFMGKIVEDAIETCTSCQYCKPNSDRNKMPLQVIERKAPFVTWGMDFVGPLPRTPRGNQYLVTAIDYGTGWAYATPLPARSRLAAVRLVKMIIENHGFPPSITTDNGSEFNGNVYQNFLAEHNIKHNRISPYHPQSNGLVERFHALFGYRTSKTAGLERSPFYMCYGVEPTVAVTYQKDRTESQAKRSAAFEEERQRQIDKLNLKATIRSVRSETKYFERNLKPGQLVLRQFKNRPNYSVQTDISLEALVTVIDSKDTTATRTSYTSATMSRREPGRLWATTNTTAEHADESQSTEQARRLATPEGMM